MNNSSNGSVIVAATLLLALAATQPVHAASVGSGSASGHALEVGLSAFSGSLSLNVGPLPAGVSVTSPPPGSVSDSVVGINEQVSHSPGLFASTYAIDLSTGLLNASAASTVDGSPGPHTSEASASVHDLDFAVGTLNLLGLISAAAVDLSAETISSTATVTGEPGGFTATGTTTLENASLDVAGLSLLGIGLGLDGMLVAEPDPNLVVLAAAGITVTLNRQLVNGEAGGSCAASHCDISVDAIAVTFEDFLLGSGGLLNGELVLGHSQASLSAVPVPAAAWLFGSGLVGLIGVARRREAAA
ncbi:VPLPA-CTERM sorting domain-containing protein [Thiohalobacter thiocyanaticus]|uniref:VPLPA-CTERM sorting domain-containing protein n=1 Tax=Thiohalobacter thiocyanaticus TaxID=585455 RepID=UPI0015B367EE|nr:VPLPA-CTERM sorting domain-containing protein [Thiohalobacter thiocyanaticus]